MQMRRLNVKTERYINYRYLFKKKPVWKDNRNVTDLQKRHFQSI